MAEKKKKYDWSGLPKAPPPPQKEEKSFKDKALEAGETLRQAGAGSEQAVGDALLAGLNSASAGGYGLLEQLVGGGAKHVLENILGGGEGTYGASIQEMRQGQQARRERSPVATMTGDILGAGIGGSAAAKAMEAAPAVPRVLDYAMKSGAGPAAARALTAGSVGAVEGAGTEIGAGGSPMDALLAGIMGAVGGGVMSPMMDAVGAASRGAKHFANRLWDEPATATSKNEAGQSVLNMIETSTGRTREGAASTLADAPVSGAPGATIGEAVLGPDVGRDITASYLRSPGARGTEGLTRAMTLSRERLDAAPVQSRELFARHFSPDKSMPASEEAFTAMRKSYVDEYDQVLESAVDKGEGLIEIQEVRNIINSTFRGPRGTKLTSAQKAANAELASIINSSTWKNKKTLNAAEALGLKKALDARILVAEREDNIAVGSDAYRRLVQVKNEVNDHLKTTVPGLREVSDKYRNVAGAEEALDVGYAAMKPGVSATSFKATRKALSPEDRVYFDRGVANSIVDIADRTTGEGAAKKLVRLQDSAEGKKLREVFGADAANKYFDEAQRLIEQTAAAKAYQGAGAEVQGPVNDPSNMMANLLDAFGAAVGAMKGDPSSRGAAGRRLANAPNRAVEGAIGDLLTMPATPGSIEAITSILGDFAGKKLPKPTGVMRGAAAGGAAPSLMDLLGEER